MPSFGRQEAYLAILEWTYFRSDAAALDLDERVEKLLDSLKKFRKMCPPAPSLPNVRRCVVTKNVSLIYEIIDKTVQIVAVIDNRMEPIF